MYMTLSNLIGPAETYSDNRSVVQALNKGDVECINVNHKDANPWSQVWDKLDVHREQDLRLREVWVRRTPQPMNRRT